MLPLLLLGADFAELFNQGLGHYQKQRFAEARPLLEQAARANAADFNTRFLLGAACSRLNDVEAAIEAWRAAERLQPRDARIPQLLAVEYAKGRYFQDALAAARRALGLKPADPAAHFLAIKAAQDAGDSEAGFMLAKAAAERFPAEARANFEYGFHLQKQGRLEEAARRLKKAMELDPAYEEPFFFYGEVLLKQDAAAEAVTYLRRAIAIRPDYVPARVTLGRALLRLERFEEALAELEECVRQSPEHPQPYLLQSQIYFRLGDERKAKQAKEKSLALRRANPALLEAVQGRPYPAVRQGSR